MHIIPPRAVTLSRSTTPEKGMRPTLIDLNDSELEGWLERIGEPKYRANQILNWVQRLEPPSLMSDLGADLRTKLEEEFETGYPEVEKTFGKEDEAVKRYLIRLADGEYVESVQIGPDSDYTLCISTQVGCGLQCAFCASGKFGLTRNLTSGEILGQVFAVRKEVCARAKADGWPRHLVYMGMGEPLQNYRPVLNSIRRLTDPTRIGFGSRRITVSTAGLVPEIYRFADEGLQVGLAVSLHAPNSDLRRSLMPIEEVYPLSKLLRACRYYIEKTRRRLTFEYVLLQGINDTPRQAKKLVQTFRDWNLVHFNLIRFNPIGLTRLKSPTLAEARAFLARLTDGGLHATLRRSPGKEIDAACGQLRGLEYEKAGIVHPVPEPFSSSTSR